MKTLKMLSLVLALTMPFSVGLRAEWFDGEVQNIDTKSRTITISEIDPITETEEKEEVLLDDATVFSGVNSLQEIRKNDNVTIDAQYAESVDVWKAISIEVAAAGA